ncbi:MAG TPA: hypothetical protein VMW38_00615, partial [Terriglobia bacterium]|nr:hypothetical protein [Terriglobia bacterium]
SEGKEQKRHPNYRHQGAEPAKNIGHSLPYKVEATQEIVDRAAHNDRKLLYGGLRDIVCTLIARRTRSFRVQTIPRDLRIFCQGSHEPSPFPDTKAIATKRRLLLVKANTRPSRDFGDIEGSRLLA